MEFSRFLLFKIKNYAKDKFLIYNQPSNRLLTVLGILHTASFLSYPVCYCFKLVSNESLRKQNLMKNIEKFLVIFFWFQDSLLKIIDYGHCLHLLFSLFLIF